MQSRRLPVYLLIDCSESMIGTGLTAMQKGLDAILRALRQNPYALETVWMSIITFDSKAELKMPLQPLEDVQAPTLRVRAGTALGSALLMLSEHILQEVARAQPGGRKGDFRPIVILITDGQSTDDWRTPLKDMKQVAKISNFYAIGCGDDVDYAALREISDIVLNLQQTDESGFAKLFVWLSDTVSSASMSSDDDGGREAMLARLPAEILKVEDDDIEESDDTPRQLFIYALCGRDTKPYLMRYSFHPDYGVYIPVKAHRLEPETADMTALSALPTELLAAFKQVDRFLQRCVAAFEPADDAFQFLQRVLERWRGGALHAPGVEEEAGEPVDQVPDDIAQDDTEKFIAEYGGAPKLPGGKAKVKTQENA